MFNFNPELMMVDGGVEAPNNFTPRRQFTPAELQNIIRRLTSGQRLTPEEAAAVGVSEPSSISTNNWNEGRAELDAAAAAARASADATRAVIAEEAARAKAAADKAAADKAAADAALASARTAAEKAAAEKAAADAKAAADKAAADKAAADAAARAAADKAAADKAAADALLAKNNTGDSAAIKALQDQIAALTKQLTGKTSADTAAAEQKAFEEKQRKENALTSLTARFSKYGLQSLIPKIRELVINGSTESTIAFELQETEEYKQRFKANTERLKKGLAVLDAGTYIGMEDSYRQALRAYGLKQFDTDDYVSQFIANDISANELSNRIVTAVQRVQNADPAITSQLREFYNIGQNDLVAYVLDPNQQFQKIERQVQAAEIGVAARRQGLQAGVGVAEQLAAQGVTQAEAQKGYATIADILPDAKKLSQIYGNTLEGYDQAQAEQEVFNQLASAQRKRQKLTQREIAAFGGSSGTNKTSLTTSAVGQF
jgi:hypothetical protein